MIRSPVPKARPMLRRSALLAALLLPGLAEAATRAPAARIDFAALAGGLSLLCALAGAVHLWRGKHR